MARPFPIRPAGRPRGALALLLLLAACAAHREGARPPAGAPAPDTEWRAYGGDKGASRYSPLDQINRTNVQRLEVAWIHHTGDLQQSARGTIEANPIIVHGLMYLTTPSLKVIALDAATGERVWTFDPYEGGRAVGVNRGVTYWESEDGTDRRILFTAGWTSRLYALDARTGRPIPSFGVDGIVDFSEGIARSEEEAVSATTPGVIYRDLFILGTRVGEGPGPTAPGDVAAYDVRTGRRRWIFHTIPHPGEFGYDTWPADAWKTEGGVNAWGGLSVDDTRGLVFLPLASPTYNFYGGHRPGLNLFSNSVVALKADTGAYVWHYQIVHHDLWDLEPSSPPNLITVTHDGRRVDAVAVVSKRGDVFVLDRETGRPLFPVEERPVPQSDLAGEQTWPTQPFPVKPPPHSRQTISEADLTERTPEANAYARRLFEASRWEGMFTPPSREGSIILPGLRGGANWSGATFDPTTGYLYVNASEVPGLIEMVPTEPDRAAPTASAGERVYRTHCASCHGPDRTGAPPSYPALLGLGDRLSRPEVRQVIDHGRGMMPPFRHLPEAEKAALVAFLFGEDAPEVQEPATFAEPPASKHPYVHTGWKMFLDQDGYPAVKPPWGSLTALDLNRGEIAWRIPLGHYPELLAQGLPPTGTDNLGGNLVTAGGLVFIGATMDEMFRAFDKRTGELLWETKLPAGGYATPSTYAVGGKQYVVIPAGGGGLLGTKPGDAVVAFALPD